MLLLTYDPNVKKTPDYVASLVSPYGSYERQRQFMQETLHSAFWILFSAFPRAEQQ